MTGIRIRPALEKSNHDSKPRLIIKTELQCAELWEDKQLVKSYRISTALNGLGCRENSFCTPSGKLKVASKIGEGLPLGAVLRSRVPTGEIWSSEAGHPLANSTEDLVLTRLLWLAGAEVHNANTLGRFVYLHGTNQESLLGQPASHGCIRFSNSDILEIYDWLQTGDEVFVE